MPIPDDDLSAESEDFLTYGDDADDDDFVPPIEATDEDLPSDAIVSLNELVGDVIEEDIIVPNHLNHATDEGMLTASPITEHELNWLDRLENSIQHNTNATVMPPNPTAPEDIEEDDISEESEDSNEIEEDEDSHKDENEEDEGINGNDKEEPPLETTSENREITPATTPEEVTEEQEVPLAHTHRLRDRNNLRAPGFNEPFDNPQSTKSYTKSVQLLPDTY